MVPCCHSRPTGHKKDEPGIYISKLCVIFKWLKTVCYSTWYIYYEKTWKVQIFYDMPWTYIYIYIQTHTYRVLNFLFLRGFQRIYTYRYTSKYMYIINKIHVPKPTANCWLLAHGMFPDWQASRGVTASRCCISTDGNRRGAASAAAARSCGWYWASEYCKYYIMNINEYQFDMVKLTDWEMVRLWLWHMVNFIWTSWTRLPHGFSCILW